jgi:hypothetical protein
MPYDDALQQAKADLNRAVMDRDKLSLEIARLQQLVKALTFAAIKDEKKGRMVQDFEAAHGFTETVLTIVRTSTMALSARGIRGRLNDLGYDLSKYANPLGFIHSVLGRLEQQGKIRQSEPGMYVFNSDFYQRLFQIPVPPVSGDLVPVGTLHADTPKGAQDSLYKSLLDAYDLPRTPVPGASDPHTSIELENILRAWGLSSTESVAVPGALIPPPEQSDLDKPKKK